jgi:hypothetical protein
MPIFSRRRLSAMLHDLAPHLSAPQAADLLARVDHCDTQPALAGEFELAVLWGIAQVADLQVGPAFQYCASRPDAVSADLFSSRQAVIEITALSDDTFSGQAHMDRAANILAQATDRIRKGVPGKERLRRRAIPQGSPHHPRLSAQPRAGGSTAGVA